MLEFDITKPGQNPLEEPSKEKEVAIKDIELHLLDDPGQIQCQFWLGLFRQGSVQPNDLLSRESLIEIYETAAVEGVCSDKPILLTHADASWQRTIYLVAVNESHEVLPKAYWMSSLAKGLQGLKTQEIGVYVPQDLEKDPSNHELLEELLLNLMHSTKVSKYYLLSGRYGVNSILNTALALKQDIRSQQNMNLSVFH